MLRSHTGREPAGTGLGAGEGSHLIVPGHPPDSRRDEESLDGWGFRDSAFSVLPHGHALLSGSRYALSGVELPDLLPWIRRVMAIDLPADDTHRSGYPPDVPPPRENPAFQHELGEILPADAVSTEPLVRLRHGHGHTLEEMYALKYGRLERVPDLVAFPASEEEVTALVEAAARHDVCLVPYGGGTTVTDALRCLPDEERPIVSLDLARMNRILWIDPVNLLAQVQAGAVGRHLQTQLAEHGFTLGHEPDSVE